MDHSERSGCDFGEIRLRVNGSIEPDGILIRQSGFGNGRIRSIAAGADSQNAPRLRIQGAGDDGEPSSVALSSINDAIGIDSRLRPQDFGSSQGIIDHLVLCRLQATRKELQIAPGVSGSKVALVECQGGTMANVIKITTYVTDMRYRADLAPIREEFFGTKGPASTLVEISALAHPDWMIEVEAIAVL